MKLLVTPPALLAVTLCACLKASPPSGSSFEIAIAPLELSGLSKVCYDLRVTNASDGAGTVVWSKGDSAVDGATDADSLCSTRFGNGGGGAITFVGACDATPVNVGDSGRTNSVTVWVDSLFATGGAQILENGSDGWRDPCPGGCTLNTLCVENADTKVEFNLTILRQANQGFFDIGVNFDNIFCSAKVDCRNSDDQPLDLLFRPNGVRDTTIVSALACTAGPGNDTRTFLYRNPLVVSCSGSSVTIPASTQKGNAYSTTTPDPNPLDAIWQYAVYFGAESLSCGGAPCNKLYWNIALGLDETFDNCTLRTRMTAAREGVMPLLSTPSSTTYPYIDVEVALTDAAGLKCERHAVNVLGSGVETRYTSFTSPVSFSGAYASGLVDECALATDNCDGNANCTDLAVGFSCTCKSGFTGNGLTCTDINECATNNGGCSADATCTNTPGSNTCACKSGFTGNGLTCADINECATNNGGCSVNATCTNSIGNRTCVCNGSYLGDGVTCLLLSLSSSAPTTAMVGDTLTLSGYFASPLTVNFPGGVSALATVQSVNLATVIVPAGATSGNVTVSVGSITSASVPLTVNTVSSGLAARGFSTNYDQASYARQMPMLNIARLSAAVLSTSTWVYVIGGTNGSGTHYNSVERARINADGTLGPFEIVAGVNLVTARSAPAVVVGNTVYVVGGYVDTVGSSNLASIERATIDSNGNLSTFSTVAGVTLATARCLHTVHVVGNSLYVIGGWTGAGGNAATIEKATINADGSLSTFAAVANVALSTRRHDFDSVIIGGYLYATGGRTAASTTTLVDRAVIGADGTVSGNFSTFTSSGSTVGLTSVRRAHRLLVVGNNLYAIGGWNQEAGTYYNTVERATINADGTISTFANVSSTTLAFARSHFGGVSVGQYAYVIGGYSGSTALKSVERLPLSASVNLSATSNASSMNVARHGHSNVVIANKLYVIGGFNPSSTPKNTVEVSTINADSSLGAFSITTTPLSVARGYQASAVIGNYLYNFGGSANESSGTTYIDRAVVQSDGTIGTFADAGVAMTTARMGHMAAVIGNRVYLFGGHTNTAGLTSVEYATIDASGNISNFTSLGNLLTAGRGLGGIAVVGNSVNLIGGYWTQGLEKANINTDNSLGGFASSGVSYNTNRYAFGTAVIGGGLYIVGGASSAISPRQPVGTIERASIDANSGVGGFSSVTGSDLATGRFHHSSILIGPYWYHIGGYGGGWLSSVEKQMVQ